MISRRIRSAHVLAASLAVLVWAGCSDDSSNPVDPGDGTGIEDEFGGYTATDEAPGFGDPDLMQALGDEVEAQDDLADDPETRDLEEDPETTTYAMTLRWGMLKGRDAGDLGGGGETVDWSGSLRTTSGRVVLTHVRSFELGDYAVMPRTDPQVLEWVSHTSGGSDGLSVLVHVPNGDDGGLALDSVYVETAAFSVAFTTEELARMDVTFDVDDLGNQIRIHAIESDRVAPQARGWVLGRWGWDADENQGHFSGQWVHPRTGIAGFVRGYYGPQEGTDRVVLFGKYIDRSGSFEGLIRGTVEVTRGDLAVGFGTFRGGWFSEDGDESGAIQGRWATEPEGGGVFSGIWCSGCRNGDVGSIGF